MEFFEQYRWLTQLALTFGSFGVYFVVYKLVAKGIRSWGMQHSKRTVRIEQVVRYFKVLMLVVLFVLVTMIWGVDYRGLWLVATSVLAVLGVALFAQWSILSNLTSGVIVFFTFPARVGDTIEIVDGVNSVKGELLEIGMFQIHVRDDEGHTLVYPNNLLLQKPVKKIQPLKPKPSKQALNWKQRRVS